MVKRDQVFVGAGINALPWFQPLTSGKEIVFRPLLRPYPVHSNWGRVLLQMGQNGLDRVGIGDICDRPQGVAAQWTARSIDINCALKPFWPTQWRAMQ